MVIVVVKDMCIQYVMTLLGENKCVQLSIIAHNTMCTCTVAWSHTHPYNMSIIQNRSSQAHTHTCKKPELTLPGYPDNLCEPAKYNKLSSKRTHKSSSQHICNKVLDCTLTKRNVNVSAAEMFVAHNLAIAAKGIGEESISFG